MDDWPWFTEVGKPISDPGVIAVGSWNDAFDLK
jgi:hypothetical protein